MRYEAILKGLGPMPLVRSGAPAAGIRDSIARAEAPESARAGLYLYAGLWDDAHDTAQAIDTPEGSYWHAIIHRQEPDTGNSSYWFRRVGKHPIFPALAERAAAIDPSLSGPWDPHRFVDYCERAARQGGEAETRAVAIQQAEWELLFAYCLSSARRG